MYRVDTSLRYVAGLPWRKSAYVQDRPDVYAAGQAVEAEQGLGLSAIPS
jgi:hypothetical protein